MKIIDCPQGSREWLEHRANHFNASDCPAMLGCSPHKSRAQLLHEVATGLTQDVDSHTQRRFDDGHRFEAMARPIAERLIGDDLYPVTVASGRLSASLDGQTLDGGWLFEHKTCNDEIRAALATEGANGDVGHTLPLMYRAQMEHQLHCSGAARTLFMASRWDGDECVEERHCIYLPDPDLRAQILAGWDQFAADLATYTPPPAAEVVVADALDSLPAVSVRMDGALVVQSNLPAFGAALKAFVAQVPKQPSTDTEFATAEAACKALKRAEEALDAAEENALASMADVNEMRRLVKEFAGLAKTTRLATEKIVAARKEELRAAEVKRGQAELAAFVRAANAELGGQYLADAAVGAFSAAIKGLKTMESIRNAIDTALAGEKVAYTQIKTRVAMNLQTIAAAEAPTLFADRTILVHKDTEAVVAIVAQRLAEHKAAQDRERERIRAEETARVEREAAARAETERQRALADAQAAAQEQAFPPIEVADVRACRPEDRAMLATPAGAAMVAATVAALEAEPAPDEPATLNLGSINAWLAPIAVTAAGLATLGIAHSAVDKSAKLYRESDKGRVRAALIRHINSLPA